MSVALLLGYQIKLQTIIRMSHILSGWDTCWIKSRTYHTRSAHRMEITSKPSQETMPLKHVSKWPCLVQEACHYSSLVVILVWVIVKVAYLMTERIQRNFYRDSLHLAPILQRLAPRRITALKWQLGILTMNLHREEVSATTSHSRHTRHL